MGTPQNKGIEMVDDDPVPINNSSVGHDFDLNVSLDLNSGIVNEYGQLTSEYTWIDEELWLSKPGEDDDQLELFNEGLLNCDYFQSQKSIIAIDQPSEYADNVVSDGGMETVIEKSSSLMNSSPNQPETPIPISIVPSKRSYSDIKNAICSEQPTENTSSGSLQFLATAISTIEQNPVVQSDSDYTMESSLSDESEEYIPSKEVRTRKISDLLDNKNSNQPVKKCTHCESTETPQWRTGPMGRFTLCNACGVQYNHGRLFADYRPLRSPTFNPSLHFHLPKKVQQIRMGYTSESLSNPTPKRPKPKKVKEKKGNNTYERDPIYTPKSKRVEKMRMGSTCERVPNPTPKVKKVEMRNDNHIDISQTITSESERVDEMALDNKKDSSLKVTSEDSILKEVSSVNDSEIELNCEHRAKNSQELQENAINLVEVDSCRRNNNYDSNRIIKQNIVPKEMKKCAHCESTQTPQWREGPKGRHTLCNACGVQYKKGKLFPEYRPLKSPTYNPLLHSHLPNKVLEMRKKNAEKCATSDNLQVIL